MQHECEERDEEVTLFPQDTESAITELQQEAHL